MRNQTAYETILNHKETLESRFPGLTLHTHNKTPNSIFPFYNSLQIAQIYQHKGFKRTKFSETLSLNCNNHIEKILELLNTYYK